ncbi:chorismate-binding protein [Maribacter halichondriae]|uniref:chorismate-binding protein n=1 Tax=Maribacter halichondriae TaxID=2980554 RepID=UPI002358BA7E|nr:chorismate-binding protein [Maribacter sp. Hal144]
MTATFFEKIEDQLSKKLPFVVYRKPRASDLIAILQEDDQLHQISDYTETGFLFAPFDTNGPSYFFKPDTVLRDNTVLHKESGQNKTDLNFHIVAKTLHLALVEKGISEIKKGTFDKVVLSRNLEVECSKQPLELFQSLISKYDSALRYLWYHPKIGMWSGATPEILLRIENNRFTTMSLAGTQRFIEDIDPTWDTKEIEEQKLVTQYIFEALKGKIIDLQVSETESVRAGMLWHLRTKLSGIMQNGLAEIIKALHPTPAVCGLPKEAAKNFILQNENYNRDFYTGFLGELNFKTDTARSSNRRNIENRAYKSVKVSTELFVNLRCMQLTDQKAIIYVGGGITKDSHPEKEWEETVAKSKTMLNIVLD